MFFSNPIRDLLYKFQSIVSTMNKIQRYLSSVLLPQSYVLLLIVFGSTYNNEKSSSFCHVVLSQRRKQDKGSVSMG